MNWKALLTASALVVTGCNVELEQRDTDTLVMSQNALSTTQTVTTQGRCTTVATLDATAAGGFTASCQSKCEVDGSLTMLGSIEMLQNGVWNYVGNVVATGAPALVGGTISTAYPNASVGQYRTSCEVRHRIVGQLNESAYVRSPIIEQLHTGDFTPPTVELTSPTDNSTVSGTIKLSAAASDNVAVQKVIFYYGTITFPALTVPPYETTFNLNNFPGVNTFTFHAKAFDAMGNVTTTPVVTVNRAACTPVTCESAAKNCGYLDDGCGVELFCGVCSSGTCGGSGVANVCGTPPPADISLTVTGRSGQRVTSNPAGLSVSTGQTGMASFTSGTSVRLTVGDGRTAIWSGLCSSGSSKTSSCTFTAQSSGSVTANVQ